MQGTRRQLDPAIPWPRGEARERFRRGFEGGASLISTEHSCFAQPPWLQWLFEENSPAGLVVSCTRTFLLDTHLGILPKDILSVFFFSCNSGDPISTKNNKPFPSFYGFLEASKSRYGICADNKLLHTYRILTLTVYRALHEEKNWFYGSIYLNNRDWGCFAIYLNKFDAVSWMD